VRSYLGGRREALSGASAFYYGELRVEEEYACIGRGVAGQLAIQVLVRSGEQEADC
jgi:hypothetical protein